MKKYNVYEVSTCDSSYSGMAFVSAESAEEANKIIDWYKASDPDNKNDSRGWCHVGEFDIVYGLFAEEPGIVYNNIYYTGW